MKERDKFVDIAKGIGILLIVRVSSSMFQY